MTYILPCDIFGKGDADKIFRELKIKNHPDHGGSAELFKSTQELYESWKNPTVIGPYKVYKMTDGDLTTVYGNLDVVAAEIVGVIRTFFSRHGDGPFNQSEVGIKLNDDHNRYNKNQGPIKYGTFRDNWRIFQKAERVVKPDGIFLTWCDKKPKGFSESLISSPIKWKSYGTTYKDKTTVL